MAENETIEQPDADAQALAAAEAELTQEQQTPNDASEEGTETETTTEQPEGGDVETEESETTDDPTPAPAAQGKPATSAIIAERRRRQEAEARAIYERGRADGLAAALKTSGKADSGQQTPETQTPQQRLAALKDRKIALASQYEAGDLTPTEYARQGMELDDQIDEVRHASRAPAAAAPRQDMRLQEETARLEAEHPILGQLEGNQIETLATLAALDMAREGSPHIVGDAFSTLELRRRTAMAATRVYGHLVQAKPAGKPKPADAKPTPGQRQGKLAAAAQHPPNLAKPGLTPGTGGHEGLTEEAILAMTPEQIAAIPKEVLDRIERQGL